MRLAEGFYMVPVTFQGPLGSMTMNMAVMVHPEFGVTLVDASMPNNVAAIESALAESGIQLKDIKRILVTHHDIDHIGSLAQLVAATGATILAHADEVPYISGAKRMVKYPPDETLSNEPKRKAMFDQIGFARVDTVVQDGDLVAGGIQVIATPGHSPGHVSLFVTDSKILVSGDALTSEGGKLAGPSVWATPDMPTAIASVRRLADLPEVAAIVTYHGGLVSDDARGQLLRVANELEGNKA